MAASNLVNAIHIRFSPLLIVLVLSGCNRDFLRTSSVDRHQIEAERERRSVALLDGPVVPELPSSETSPTDIERAIAENLRLGQMEADAGRLDQAARYYSRVLRDNEKHPVAHRRLAVIADEAGQPLVAEGHYRAALEANPADPDLLNDVGRFYFLQGRYHESERTLRQAAALAPSDPHVLNNLAILYKSLGETERAISVSERLAEAADGTIVPVAQLPGVTARPVGAAETGDALSENPYVIRPTQFSNLSRSNPPAESKGLAPQSLMPLSEVPPEAGASGRPHEMTADVAARAGLQPYRRHEAAANAISEREDPDRDRVGPFAAQSIRSATTTGFQASELRADLPLWIP